VLLLQAQLAVRFLNSLLGSKPRGRIMVKLKKIEQRFSTFETSCPYCKEDLYIEYNPTLNMILRIYRIVDIADATKHYENVDLSTMRCPKCNNQFEVEL